MREGLLFDRVATPIGETLLICDGAGRLVWASWNLDLPLRFEGATAAANPFGRSAALESYMTGDIDAVKELPVSFEGTPFQTSVWTALRAIPAGQTTSYAALAKTIGRPKAVRAVGLANGANPVPIVVPCHRVIGSDGSLTGFGGGLERKRWLLAHEARYSRVGPFRLEATPQRRGGQTT